MHNSFKQWFDSFLAEKEIDTQVWKIKHKELIHFIDTEFVIAVIRNHTTPEEQEKIKNIITYLDITNADINHFFKHLAEGYIKTNYGNS